MPSASGPEALQRDAGPCRGRSLSHASGWAGTLPSVTGGAAPAPYSRTAAGATAVRLTRVPQGLPQGLLRLPQSLHRLVHDRGVQTNLLGLIIGGSLQSGLLMLIDGRGEQLDPFG